MQQPKSSVYLLGNHQVTIPNVSTTAKHKRRCWKMQCIQADQSHFLWPFLWSLLFFFFNLENSKLLVTLFLYLLHRLFKVKLWQCLSVHLSVCVAVIHIFRELFILSVLYMASLLTWSQEHLIKVKSSVVQQLAVVAHCSEKKMQKV